MSTPAPSTAPNVMGARLSKLAPRPSSLHELGISVEILTALASRHLVAAEVLSMSELSRRLAVAGPILDGLLALMRKQGLIELRAKPSMESELRFGLTERGRAEALDSLARNGYVGPVPVPLEKYADVARRQSVHKCRISRGSMHIAFADVVISGDKLDQLGPALNSGRAIFLYGEAGTGKTYMARRLSDALWGSVLVPHAICVNDTIIPIFDPLSHRKADSTDEGSSLLLEEGHDPRFVLCRRPLVISGGELTPEMLEVQFDATARLHKAPLQLKANNGLLLIDDLGRQRISCDKLLNRWIVPMEEQQDYLSSGYGQHFAVPFDTVLVFSTNLEPRDIADEAFLRRIGYKISFGPIPRDEYERIWQGVCAQRAIEFDAELVSWVIRELHEKNDVPLLPCHPRDLLGMALDLGSYESGGRRVDERSLHWAWHNYFLRERADEQKAKDR
jgi:DNA-binding MarR family transcriptional regulator